MGVGEQVVVPRVRSGLGVCAELLADRISDDRILDRDVLRTHAVDVIPLSELDRYVFEDQVAGVEQVKTAFPAIRVEITLSEADVPHNIVRRAAEGDFAAHDTDADTWRSLSVDGQVAGHTYRRGKIDVSADAEIDNAAALAHCVSERAGAGIREGSDVVDRAIAAAGCVAAEADRTWEGQCGEPRTLREYSPGSRQRLTIAARAGLTLRRGVSVSRDFCA